MVDLVGALRERGVYGGVFTHGEGHGFIKRAKATAEAVEFHAFVGNRLEGNLFAVCKCRSVGCDDCFAVDKHFSALRRVDSQGVVFFGARGFRSRGKGVVPCRDVKVDVLGVVAHIAGIRCGSCCKTILKENCAAERDNGVCHLKPGNADARRDLSHNVQRIAAVRVSIQTGGNGLARRGLQTALYIGEIFRQIGLDLDAGVVDIVVGDTGEIGQEHLCRISSPGVAVGVDRLKALPTSLVTLCDKPTPFEAGGAGHDLIGCFLVRVVALEQDVEHRFCEDDFRRKNRGRLELSLSDVIELLHPQRLGSLSKVNRKCGDARVSLFAVRAVLVNTGFCVDEVGGDRRADVVGALAVARSLGVPSEHLGDERHFVKRVVHVQVHRGLIGARIVDDRRGPVANRPVRWLCNHAGAVDVLGIALGHPGSCVVELEQCIGFATVVIVLVKKIGIAHVVFRNLIVKRLDSGRGDEREGTVLELRARKVEQRLVVEFDEVAKRVGEQVVLHLGVAQVLRLFTVRAVDRHVLHVVVLGVDAHLIDLVGHIVRRAEARGVDNAGRSPFDLNSIRLNQFGQADNFHVTERLVGEVGAEFLDAVP